MGKYLLGPLFVAVLGYFCGVGETGDIGWLQVLSAAGIAGGVGMAIPMVLASIFGEFRHIATLYGVAFTVGVLTYVVANSVHGA